MILIRNPGQIVISVLVGFVLLGTGCGDSGTISIKGTVTWDGRNLPTGRIVFVDLDPHVPAVSAEIKDGTYEAEVPPGKKLVRITATREKPGAKPDPDMGAVPRESYIPFQYNARTKLNTTITTGGKTELDFHLKP